MDARKRNIVIAIMVAMFLGAVEGTVVSTAVPTIVRDLHGFAFISWVFSLYLLTSAISTPIYGKLSDLYGRKHVLTTGIAIFLVGSTLCGLAGSMAQLIAFRALQGLGAGAIFTVTYTIVGDLFCLAERARVQGWLSTVWGIASLVGPFLGGFLIDTLSWHWIFFINLPFGLLSIILLQRNLNEQFQIARHRIDYAGAAALSLAIIALMNGVMSGRGILISLVLTAVFLAAFYLIETRAGEPLIPFEIFTRTNSIANAISFLAAAVLIGVEVYIPVYIQNVLGYSALISGLSIAPLSVAWLLSSVVLTRAIPRYGERVATGLSVLIMLGSCLLLPTLGLQSPLALVVIYSTIIGFGFGGSFTTLIIVVQSSVDYGMRGAATASNSLLRTLGQTVGVSIFGGLFNLYIVRYFNNIGIRGINPNDLYASGLGVHITLAQVKASLNSALHVVFIAFILIAMACMFLSVVLPSELKEQPACD